MRHETALITIANAKPKALPTGFDGVWKNELGSTMDLIVQDESVTGIYTSKKSLKQGGGTITGKIVGFAADDILSIVVKWDGASSFTAWVGQVVTGKDGKDSLNTMWHLIRNTEEAEEPDYAWASVLAGADIFHR